MSELSKVLVIVSAQSLAFMSNLCMAGAEVDCTDLQASAESSVQSCLA